MKIIATLFLACGLLFGFSAKVVKVSDGDTITVLTQNKESIKVRLYGIDAPETKQDFGKASKQYLSSLIAGRIVEVKSSGQDRYGRVLGTIYLGSTDINAKMVENGYAWAFVKYSKIYAAQQSKAMKNKAGLWRQKDPQAPWDFRKAKKRKQR